MGKNKKGDAPQVQIEQPKDEQKAVNDATAAARTAGLDPNRRMDLVRVMHETFRMDPMAAAHTGLSQESVNKINKINAAMQLSVLICEVQQAKNEFTMLMPPEMVQSINEVGAEMGVHLNTKLLPSPDADGKIAVPTKAIVVDPKTKKEAKEEIAIVEELPELNHQKITTDEQLRKALIYTLADTKTNMRPYDRINAAIDLFKSFLYFKATTEEEKKNISSMERANLLHDMITKVGKCPFSVNGFAKILYNSVAQTKSPISAFCMFRNASLEKDTGHPTIDDQAVADFVKAVVIWTAESNISDVEESIETCKNNIKTLSKNKKQNAKAIEKEEGKIKTYEETIECHKDVIGFVTNPSGDLADKIYESFDNKEHDDYKTVHRVCSNILETYFPEIKNWKEIEHESFLENMQQFIGIIINFFRDPGQQLANYKESNITPFVMEEKKEETPEEPVQEEEKEPKK